MTRSARLLPALLACWAVAAATARAEGPADGLLRLVPPDAGVTLVVEDLRGHLSQFLDSPLADGLRRLPAVRAWLASDRFDQLRRSRRDIEAALGVDLAKIRDDLLGEAVVLTLQASPDGVPDHASGLLLSRVRDRDLLQRLIAAVNSGQKRDGELVEVSERKEGSTPYFLRKFRPGARPTEVYTILADGTFAWSNSEAMIRGVIGRSGGRPGLGDEPRFRKVRSALPADSAASLFVDPRFLERVAAADPRPRPAKPGDDRIEAMLRRYLSAVEYAGAALQWRDGFVLHTHEAIDPAKLDDPWTRWAAREGSADALVRRVPATALALATGHVDLGALADAAVDLVPEADRPRVDNMLAALRGILLGRDPRTAILPNLGPGLVAYLDTPPDRGTEIRFPLVVAVGLADDSGVSAALDNALQTLLALAALDPKRAEPGARVESRDVGGVRVTTLAGGRVPFAYALDRGALVLGSSPEAVAGFFASGPGGSADSRFRKLRAAYFPEAETFLFADLDGLRRWADAHRADLARRLAADRHAPADDARRDLDQVLALMGLFRGAYATSAIDKGFASAHRTFGLIAREPAAKK
jgi:hypothetical protein